MSSLQTLFQAYLMSFLYWIAFPLGAMVFLMIHRLAGGAWGPQLERQMRAAVRTLPLLCVAALPVIAGVKQIFPWAAPEVRELLHGGNRIYLTPLFFAVRMVIYLFGWWIVARAVLRAHPDSRKWAAGGLIFYGFSISFAAFDWQMSTDPECHSTIYGLIFAVGELLQAWAGILLVLACGDSSWERIGGKLQRDLMNLLLAYVMVWAYLSFSQYLIIWSGNLPDEVTWLARRTKGGWRVPAIVMSAFQFALPLSALLFRSVKRRSRAVIAVCATVLLTRVIEQYWMVEPDFHPGQVVLNVWFVPCIAALGTVWGWYFKRCLREEETAHVRA